MPHSHPHPIYARARRRLVSDILVHRSDLGSTAEEVLASLSAMKANDPDEYAALIARDPGIAAKVDAYEGAQAA